MAELHGISCYTFLPSVLIIEGVGGMGGGAGQGGIGWEMAKTPVGDTHEQP